MCFKQVSDGRRGGFCGIMYQVSNTGVQEGLRRDGMTPALVPRMLVLTEDVG